MLSALFHVVSSKDEVRTEEVNDVVTKRINNALESQSEFLKIVEENYSEGRFRLLDDPNPEFPTFVFQSGKLLSWSDNRFLPPYEALAGDYAIKVIESNGVTFIARKKLLEGRNTDIEIYSIIILQQFVEVENDYLQSGVNKEIIPYSRNVEVLGASQSIGIPIFGDGQLLFRLKLDDNFNADSDIQLYWSYLFFLLASLSLCVGSFFYFSAKFWFKRVLLALSLFTIFLLVFRALLLYFNLPNSIWQSKLFSSKFFFHNNWNPSLGDILVNYFLVFLLVLLVQAHFAGIRRLLLGERLKFFKLLIKLGFVFLSFVFLQMHAQTILNFAQYSQLSLDISKGISIDVLNVGSYILIVLLAVSFFIFHHIAITLLDRHFNQGIYKISSIAIVYGIAYFFVGGGTLFGLVVIGHFVFALVTIYTDWLHSLKRLRYSTYLYFFCSIILSSLIYAAAIYQADEYKVLIKKQKFANQLLLENDVLAEFLISEAVNKIKSDVQLVSRFMNPVLVSNLTYDRIKQLYFNNYLEKYDVKFTFFSYPRISQEVDTLNSQLQSIKSSFAKPEYATDYNNIFFVNDALHFDKSRYYVFVPLERYGISLGELVIDFQPKMYMPSSVYPELLIDKRFSYPADEVFNYALYLKGEFIYESGNYNYLVDFNPELLKESKFYSEGLEDGLYHHLGVRGSDEKVFVISSELYPNEAILSNFSFLFQLFIVIMAVLSLGNALRLRFQDVGLNFASRLQIYLSLVMFLPLLIISAAIINSINKSYSEEIELGYRSKADNISRNFTQPLSNYFDNKINRDDLNQTVSNISRFAQIDINIYDPRGKLVSTSQPRVFDSNLVSDYINPRPFYLILAGEEESLTYDETIGSFAYRSTYHAIRSFEDGKLLGILSIPFFQSKAYLEKQKVEVFNTIINIVTFIFIAAFILSNFATAVITRPLNLIADKLKKTKLEGENQPLVWKSNDEIGMLVTEYNKMLLNLEKSREVLSQNEKEMAWREMARQVAHEIKNPLTPMKLTLQQLQRTAHKEIQSEKNQYMENSLKTLLLQVDTLSDIATSFSAFAQMPIPQNQKMNLVEVVGNVIVLFEKKCQIVSEVPNTQVSVFADSKLIGRILNNLLLNGIQSVPSDREPVLKIILQQKEGMAHIAVSDNGSGIDPSIQPKVFIPNFSTKTSGSGLGLAIAKRGIEHAGGRIWFETEIDHGTTFFLELPIIDE
jgi:two-component system nitrogen regulation sensor histidine kinase NtrY